MNNRIIKDGVLEIRDEKNELIAAFFEEFNDGVVKINIKGELRNDTAHDFKDEILAVISIGKKVRLDLSGVTYIASYVMDALLTIQSIVDERSDAALIICGLSPQVKEIFEEKGFMDILNVEDS